MWGVRGGRWERRRSRRRTRVGRIDRRRVGVGERRRRIDRVEDRTGLVEGRIDLVVGRSLDLEEECCIDRALLVGDSRRVEEGIAADAVDTALEAGDRIVVVVVVVEEGNLVVGRSLLVAGEDLSSC